VQMEAIFTRASRESYCFAWLARGVALFVAMAALICVQSAASAATAPVPLGTAANFAVLAGSTVTNTGPTTINGDLGLSPGTSVTGFPPGQVNGTIHAADSVALQAQTDLTAAYNNAAARPITATIPTELGGTTETPGVYNSAAGTFGITGTLTLDAQGDPNAVFIFQAASTLITAAASNVTLTNGAQASNVFWVVGSSATLGTSSTLQGNVLALTSITVTTGTTIHGRALARNGAVTLDTNTITALTPGLTITKTAATSNTPPGGIVQYTITVADTGQTPYTGATFTDSMAGVLDDAAYDSDAVATAGAVSYTSPNLTWTGDLAVGGTATITYSVTVDNPDTGSLTLTNTVSSATPGSNCPPGSTDPRCGAVVNVVTGVLSITAPASADLGTATPGGIANAALGPVQVTDERAGLAVAWTATVSSTDFTTGGGSAAETIPVRDTYYLINGFTATTGSATFTPTSVTGLSTAAQAVVSATNVNGDNSATWNPVIRVSVPAGAVAGTYTATITQSVS
jgi:uncharacterized repeat protein (TIGR01451 family)